MPLLLGLSVSRSNTGLQRLMQVSRDLVAIFCAEQPHQCSGWLEIFLKPHPHLSKAGQCFHFQFNYLQPKDMLPSVLGNNVESPTQRCCQGCANASTNCCPALCAGLRGDGLTSALGWVCSAPWCSGGWCLLHRLGRSLTHDYYSSPTGGVVSITFLETYSGPYLFCINKPGIDT